jgi:exopolysaccharide biosynthesis protein
MFEVLTRTLLALGVLWHAVSPGVWRAELPMAGDGPLAPVRAIAIRMDPQQLRFDVAQRDEDVSGGWTVEATPATAVVAFNAGQFTGPWPWGWLVRDGVELQVPGTGTVTMSFVVDSTGAVSLVTPDELPVARKRARTAFQSYPALLGDDGEMPWELQADGRGVDLRHRDSRLAIGTLEDGSIIVVLTRFIGLGDAGETLPWGPTVVEMAEFMRSLGCQRAMLLDGGISGQLALRQSDGELKRWKNWRTVPLGLVVSPRPSERLLSRVRG